MKSDSETLLKTPLHSRHKNLKAKLLNFNGWDMPISYESVLNEHHFVRQNTGLFDVSHMGEVFVSGPQTIAFLQHITINDVSKLNDCQGQYTAMCLPSGGIIDDLILYRIKEDRFLLCLNAGNIEKDFQWINEQSKQFSVEVENQSRQWGQLAVQGPKCLDPLNKVFPNDHLGDMNYCDLKECLFESKSIFIARTGYTGEKGFEIYAPNESVGALWDRLMEQIDSEGNPLVKAIGLGARDTLRLESCYLLYGNDINEETTPLQAGISWATKLNKGEFIGREALISEKENGLKKKLYAFKMVDSAIPRKDMEITLGGERIGNICSGSVLPTVGGAGGLCYIDSKYDLKAGDHICVNVRGKEKKAILVKKPFYQANVKN